MLKDKKQRDADLVRHLLRCYPRCTESGTADHLEFVDDLSDLLIARGPDMERKLRFLEDADVPYTSYTHTAK